MKKLKIQSVGDIITNSSSEVFVIKCEDTWEEVEKDIMSWKIQDQCSGMGGEISVYDNKRPYDTGDSSKYEDPFFPWLAEGYLAVDIDWNLEKHIDRIFKKYDVVGSEEADLIYNTQSRKYRRTTDKDRKKGISQEESILLAGDGDILKMQKEYYSNLMKESEEAINKIYGMDEAKKAHKLWSDYMHSQAEIESLNINEEEYKTDTLSANDDMHKKYKKSCKTRSVLNPLDEEFNGMCFSCQHYNDYGPVAGRFGDYNGRCKADNHETNALVRCSINKYKRIEEKQQ